MKITEGEVIGSAINSDDLILIAGSLQNRLFGPNLHFGLLKTEQKPGHDSEAHMRLRHVGQNKGEVAFLIFDCRNSVHSMIVRFLDGPGGQAALTCCARSRLQRIVGL